MNIEDKIKEYFPDAVDVSGDSSGASWMSKGKGYSFSYNPRYYLSAATEYEDWGTYGETLDEVLENAIEGDWSDHGFMLREKHDTNNT